MVPKGYEWVWPHPAGRTQASAPSLGLRLGQAAISNLAWGLALIPSLAPILFINSMWIRAEANRQWANHGPPFCLVRTAVSQRPGWTTLSTVTWFSVSGVMFLMISWDLWLSMERDLGVLHIFLLLTPSSIYIPLWFPIKCAKISPKIFLKQSASKQVVSRISFAPWFILGVFLVSLALESKEIQNTTYHSAGRAAFWLITPKLKMIVLS